MDFLTGSPPSVVEVGGEAVPIRTGWRRAVRSYAVTGKGPGGVTEGDARALLALWFARDGRLPDAVMGDPAGALLAALEWRERAMEEAVPYGRGRPSGRSSDTFDFEADSAIICADFLRLYGIDLATWQAHWWRFCSLMLPLALTEGSLLNAAMSARAPLPQGLPKEARDARRALQRAWALPVPEAERIRLENERIAREW